MQAGNSTAPHFVELVHEIGKKEDNRQLSLAASIGKIRRRMRKGSIANEKRHRQLLSAASIALGHFEAFNMGEEPMRHNRGFREDL